MLFGKVIGQVVSTRKEGNIDGLRLLILRELNPDLSEGKKIGVSIDTVNAGPGDVVLYCTSSSARKTDITKNVCADNTIVAIVDTVTAGGKKLYQK